MTQLIEHETRPYTLLSVFDTGVLLEGPSGSGKSDAALALVREGHQFIADDGVLLQVQDKQLYGRNLELNHGEIFIKGMGILSIPAIFGQNALLPQKKISLKINLAKENNNNEIDQFTEEQILGIKIAAITLPFSEQRQLSILIEAATKCFLLREKGYNAAIEFNKRQRNLMDKL